jgi:methylase of polypeptide subunit release factors
VSELPPVPDVSGELLEALRDVLDRANYGAAAAERDAQGLQRVSATVGTLSLPAPTAHDDRVTALVALLAASDPVAPVTARRALHPIPIEDLAGAGLLEVSGGSVRSTVRALPFDDLVLLGDSDGGQDVVAPSTRPSRLAAWLTPHDARRSMLDLGTGSGVLALWAARHCARVVGVDVNRRALGFAELNRRLNGVENVEWLEGDWLEPVAGERFDLIVSNPPYVVSPDSEFTYRDSGMPGAELVARLCREIPAYLEENGLAIVLGMWPHATSEDWEAAPRAWVQGSGCDALVVCFETVAPLAHALAWNSPPARLLDPAVFRETVARWNRYFCETGTGAISFGAIVFRRRRSSRHWTRLMRASTAPSEGAARQLMRIMTGNDFLERSPDLLDHRYATPLRLDVAQRFVLAERGWLERAATLSLPGELGVSADVDPDALNALFGCNGETSLRDLLKEGDSAAAALSAVTRLLTSGLLEPL